MENENLPNRKSTKWRERDYNTPGGYFITICTQNKRCILSHIVGGDVLDAPKRVDLLPHGKIANKHIKQLNDFYADPEVAHYVIMPNHIHILLFVHDRFAPESGASRTSPPTAKQHAVVSRFVSTFKRFCNKEFGGNVWQRGFHDHIIRNRADLEEHLKYICENPLKWTSDPLYV